MTTRRSWSRILPVVLTVVALIATLFLVGGPTPSGAAPSRRFSVTPLDVTSRSSTPKTASSRLAESDPTLLQGGSGTVAIVVKLDYDSLATYNGTIAGLAPTSPAATGNPLDTKSSAGVAYTRYVEAKERDFEARLRTVSASARVGRKLRTVYGGVGLVVPAADVAAIAQLPGVVAVQRDAKRELLTDSSPEFIGAPALYDQLGSTDRNAGRGVIVGILDSGSWPEHPSYLDTETLPAPPPRADGQPRVCDFGDNPLTVAVDVFPCNNKLIGGQPFLDTYNEVGLPEVYPDSARDGNGHGTHTSTTSAGSYVEEAPVFGVDRGPIHGIAPGAYVSAYKVCGTEGCFSTDSAAAVGAAIEDGVRVINFSISGGATPLTDVVELAFLDAYQAGVFVAASAGNSGPGAATAGHLSPWVTTVAASTQARAFQSTLTLTGGSGTLELVGASITRGVGPAPVVQAASAPYSDPLCLNPAPPGLFAGKIVVCERSPGRALKGFNVLQGGAVGMILYNPTTQETLTDNHFLPTVHLEGPQGAQLLAFLAANPGTTATFTTGQKGTAQGDVITSFSSRGPGGVSIKPDITAPGAQILAGHTPTPDEVAGGPAGELFQAIAGTSMSSPHIAGSAALVAALHPDWDPGQIKSALMTTANTDVVKEDTVTPADPFDTGSGRVDLTRAGDPGLTFSDTAARMFVFTGDPVHAVDINVPSVNAPVMPGRITTQRSARNTTDGPLTFTAITTAPVRSRIKVVPSTFTVRAGETVNLSITIDGKRLKPGQYFGQIRLLETSGDRELHLPVAFNRQQGSVAMSQICNPSVLELRAISLCKVTIRNNSFTNTAVQATTKIGDSFRLLGQTGAQQTSRRTVKLPLRDLEGKKPATPTIAPGETPGPGYLDLEEFGIAPEALGDEDFLNFDIDPYLYGGDTFSTVGISSNGYLVAGGGTSEDNQCCPPQTLPDPARPNNVLAAFWSDLDGTGAEGLRAAILSDDETGDAWVLVQWDVYLYGTTTPVATQAWIGLNGTEDVSYAYPGPQPDPGVAGLTVGAENVDGSAGAQVSQAQSLSGASLRVATDGGAKGEAAIYRIFVKGVIPGNGIITTAMTSPAVSGTTTKRSVIPINP